MIEIIRNEYINLKDERGDYRPLDDVIKDYRKTYGYKYKSNPKVKKIIYKVKHGNMKPFKDALKELNGMMDFWNDTIKII